MNHKVLAYLKLKKKYDKCESIEDQDEIFEKMEEMYYEFDDDEVAYIEEKEIENDR
jgi:hypothetical protein